MRSSRREALGEKLSARCPSNADDEEDALAIENPRSLCEVEMLDGITSMERRWQGELLSKLSGDALANCWYCQAENRMLRTEC